MDGNGHISTDELTALFKEANLPLPGYRVREIVQELSRTMDLNQDGKITFDEFAKVRSKVTALSSFTPLGALVLSRNFKQNPFVSGGARPEELRSGQDLP